MHDLERLTLLVALGVEVAHALGGLAHQVDGVREGQEVAQLENEPDDADGWRMLAHSYETLRRFDAAVEAYRHLIALEPNNANELTDAAVALGMTLDQDLSGEPERLIDRALAINPNHVQALALKGSAAYERGDYAQAIPPWKKILAMVPQDSEMARSIAASVAKAETFAAKTARR